MDAVPSSPQNTETPGAARPPAGAPPPAPPPSRGRVWLGRVARAALALVILGGGAWMGIWWFTHKPTAGRRRPEPRPRLVRVQTVRPGRHRVLVQVMGEVVPARTVQLAPRVGGQVVEMNPEFLPGGRLKAGEVVVQIDPEDYRLAVRSRRAEADRLAALAAQAEATLEQRAADLVQAEANLAIEMGRQAVAQREYALLGQGLPAADEALVLRRPQRDAAKAAVDAARAAQTSAEAALRAARAAEEATRAALAQAELDLARTAVRAPFNALVQSRSVNLGSQVAAGTPLGVLVGTDTYWVRVSVPVDELKWLRIPRAAGEEGSPARIYDRAAWGPGVFRRGTVLRLESGLEPQGRMARVLVAVPDPLASAVEGGGAEDPGGRPPPLLLGSYVRVDIEGVELDGVVALERRLLREGDRVWVMDAANRLRIRPVRVAYRGRERVLVSEGLAAGDRVVVTDLMDAVDGMPLRTEPTPPASGKEAAEAAWGGSEAGHGGTAEATRGGSETGHGGTAEGDGGGLDGTPGEATGGVRGPVEGDGDGAGAGRPLPAAEPGAEPTPGAAQDADPSTAEAARKEGVR